MSSITCDHTFEDVDFLLRRNWFLDVQDIFGLLHELPEEMFLQVWNRSQSYPEPVRSILTDYANVPKTKYTIRNQSDEEIGADDQARTMRRYYRLKDHKASFQCPPRPREPIDDEYVAIQSRLNKKREAVEELKNLYVRTRRYVPPSQRKSLTYQDDPVIRDSMNDLTTLENEFQRVSEHIAALDKTWSELAWIDATLADAAKRPSFLSDARVKTPSA